MFYKTEVNDHGMDHDPFKAIVTPMPIGWIGSVDKEGIANLAPYSYFNAISDKPYFIMFSSACAAFVRTIFFGYFLPSFASKFGCTVLPPKRSQVVTVASKDDCTVLPPTASMGPLP